MTETKRRVGRPKKSLVDSKKEGNRNKVGRPKGDADAIKDGSYNIRWLEEMFLKED